MEGRNVHSSKCASSETATVVFHCPKRNKNVVLMSTMHRDASLSAREDLKHIGIKFIIFHNVMIKIKLSYIVDSLHSN